MESGQADIATELRAELGRQRKSYADAATAVGISKQAMGKKLNGDIRISFQEMVLLTRWLGVDLDRFVPPSLVGAA